MGIPSLPVEILSLIVAAIPNTQDRLVDLVQLGLSCHRMHVIAKQELYRRAVRWDQALGPQLVHQGKREAEISTECPWRWGMSWYDDLGASVRRTLAEDHGSAEHHLDLKVLLPAASTRSLALSPPTAVVTRAVSVPAAVSPLQRAVPPPVLLVAAATDDVGLLDRLLRLGLGFSTQAPRVNPNETTAAVRHRVLQYLTATYYQPAPYHSDMWPWKYWISPASKGTAGIDYHPESDPELHRSRCHALLSPLHLAAQYGNERFTNVLLDIIHRLTAATAAPGHLLSSESPRFPLLSISPVCCSSPPWWLEVRARSANLGSSRHLAFLAGGGDDDGRGGDARSVKGSSRPHSRAPIGHNLTDPSDWPAATALHLALAHGHEGVAALLIGAGANWDRAVSGAWGMNALSLMAANGHVELVEWLDTRARGRDRQQQQNSSSEKMRQLLYRDLPDHEGLYALHYACLAPQPGSIHPSDADMNVMYEACKHLVDWDAPTEMRDRLERSSEGDNGDGSRGELDTLRRLIRGLIGLGAVTSETPGALARRVADIEMAIVASNAAASATAAAAAAAASFDAKQGTDSHHTRDGMQNIFPGDGDPQWLVEYDPVAERVTSRQQEGGVMACAAELRPAVAKMLGQENELIQRRLS